MAEGDYINPLGEIPDAPRPWVNGESPWVFRDKLICGNAGLHANGQLFSSRVDFEPLNWGIPPCCDPTPLGACPTVFDIGVNHPGVWYAGAVIIRALYLRDEIALTALWENLLGSGCVIKFSFPADALAVGFTVAWNDRQVCIAIEGQSNWFQFVLDTLGTVLPLFPFGVGNVNAVMYGFAADVMNRLSLLGVPIDLPRVYFGHSLGGAIAQMSLAVRKMFDAERVQHAICYGAPKCGNTAFANFVAPHLSEIRVFTDPVPFIPLNFTEFIFLHVPVPLPYRLLWDAYKKPTQGFSVTAMGELAPDTSGVGAFSEAVLISQAILTGIISGEPFGHLISTYTQYLAIPASQLPAIPDCTIDVEEIEVIDDSFPDVNPRNATFKATTCDIYRTGTAPPAPPAVAAEPCFIYANFWIRTESGEGDAAVGHFSHVMLIPNSACDIRDDYNEGTRGANFDIVYIPDSTATTGLVVRFVERMYDPDTAAEMLRVYLDRKKPTAWPPNC